jgi:hypothetical protein
MAISKIRSRIDDRLGQRAQARARFVKVAGDHHQIRGVARQTINGGDI